MASIDTLRASDGSGNASVATIQNSRSPGATTLVVDTVQGINSTFHATMGTPHTFVDPVTSETITVISEATAVDFQGHVDGTNLEIDVIAPGYTDNGSSANDIVIIKPTTQWADEVANVLEASHEDDGKIKAGAIDDSNMFGALSVPNSALAGGITGDKLGSNAILLGQAQITTSSTTTSGSFAVGSQQLGVLVTIPDVARRVRVTVYSVLLTSNSPSNTVSGAIFSGATVGTLTTQRTQWNGGNSTTSQGMCMQYISSAPLTPGSLAFTFAMLIGGGSTATLTAGNNFPATITVELV